MSAAAAAAHHELPARAGRLRIEVHPPGEVTWFRRVANCLDLLATRSTDVHVPTRCRFDTACCVDRLHVPAADHPFLDTSDDVGGHRRYFVVAPPLSSYFLLFGKKGLAVTFPYVGYNCWLQLWAFNYFLLFLWEEADSYLYDTYSYLRGTRLLD